MAVAVHGLKELNRTFKHAPKDARLAIRKEYRTVAEPVRVTAATLAGSSIRRIGPNWSRMRTGVTQQFVYVAPRQRGAKAGPRKRRNLAPLLATRALEPALKINEHRIEADFERMVDRLVAKWGSEGP